jgi:hypothetical protein
MATSRVRFKDKLDGVSNYSLWKELIMLVLMKNGILEYANSVVAPLADPKDLNAHSLKDVKARRIILDRVKDHMIPHFSGKKLTNAMW